ncbi:MAG: D-alanyl-D-alanine carboxypeptidase [Bacilli bacterium]|nr:D-alanyl-D-alanine carboxypeptidase [Bacilli bacterium]
MKKLCLFIVLILFPHSVLAISAASSIAMDLTSGRIFHANNIDEKRLIASTTKIMTAIVTIENSNLEEMVTVGEEVLKAYGSAIYIEVGEELSLKDLLLGLMLRSGNDAAIVIANHVADNMQNFADLMNTTAARIGMKNTHFYNAHGLEEDDGNGNTSTAYDMALLTKYAMENETFKEIFGTKKHVVKTNYKTYSWTNKNKLLHSYEYTTGGKTGFTEKARRTLVTTASKDNIDIVVVTLNDPNDFYDHKSLYETIFAEYKAELVLDKTHFEIKNETRYKDHTLYINKSVYIPIKEDEKDDLEIKYELLENNTYQDNDVVGSAKIYLKGEFLCEENIYVDKKESEEKLSWWKKIIRWFKKW